MIALGYGAWILVITGEFPFNVVLFFLLSPAMLDFKLERRLYDMNGIGAVPDAWPPTKGIRRSRSLPDLTDWTTN